MLAALVVVAQGACRGETPPAPVDAGVRGTAQERARALLAPESRLPNRAEVVALSDELAVAAARASGTEAARLAKAAADLRARAWRAGHVEADAREALELYASASRGRGDEACDAALGHASIGAELARDPRVLYREAYLAERSFGEAACAKGIAETLRALSAWRPPPDALARLDAEAVKRRGEAEAEADAAATAPSSAADENGVVVSPRADAEGPVKVVSIDPYGGEDRARIVVTLSGATRFDVGALAGDGSGRGPRIFVDLARAKAKAREVAVDGIVERVRVAPRGGGVRVVLDLSSAAYRRVFYLPEPFRIVIDVATHPPSSAAAPSGATRPVTRVAIDPGHGGSDPGAIGPSGLREKDVTLDIAHRVAPVLSRELGIMTLLTRDDDRYVPLAERTARANAFHADLFVSVHCNASENGAARGVMTFVLDTTRDEIAAKVAARENATSMAANAQLANVVGDLKLADLGARSTKLASLLERTTMASLGPRWSDATDLGVKTAGFFVLVGAEMPSVLFETSFISNPAEEARLATAEYRQKLADAIVNAVRAYREGR